MPLLVAPPYKPPKVLSNQHLQTIFPTLFRKAPKLNYLRERFELSDGDFLDLDGIAGNGKRLVIVLHGLEGSSDSKYVRGILHHLNNLGWDGMAVNFRSCSGEPNRQSRFYHSGDTADLREVINHVLRHCNYEGIDLVGFSLGGNVLLKYLGEEKEQAYRLRGRAVAISVPVDLVESAGILDQRHNWLYRRRFMRKLNKKLQSKPDLLPHLQGKKMYHFAEFDEVVTAPLHGFASAPHYWQSASCKPYLAHLKIPTLLINALNDPFLGPKCFPEEAAKANPHFHLLTPEKGGHVGFPQWKSHKYW
ncbi:MAG: alpha/beta fold hydrolase, partial [Bacteroidota bacterium]